MRQSRRIMLPRHACQLVLRLHSRATQMLLPPACPYLVHVTVEGHGHKVAEVDAHSLLEHEGAVVGDGVAVDVGQHVAWLQDLHDTSGAPYRSA